jgi:hypothetical protein
LGNDSFYNYYIKTWGADPIIGMWDFSPRGTIIDNFRTNNSIEREFLSIKTALTKDVAINIFIEDLYFYTKTKISNSSSKVIQINKIRF